VTFPKLGFVSGSAYLRHHGMECGREVKFKTWVVGSLLKAIRVNKAAGAMVRICAGRGAESDI
jgi:hypothetical protein